MVMKEWRNVHTHLISIYLVFTQARKWGQRWGGWGDLRGGHDLTGKEDKPKDHGDTILGHYVHTHTHSVLHTQAQAPTPAVGETGWTY